MNSSRKTTIIAEGIFLWAQVQNLKGDDDSDSALAFRRGWELFEQAYPHEVIEFVQKEQFNLFDRVNAAHHLLS